MGEYERAAGGAENPNPGERVRRDPSLDIPEALRTPVDRPESLKQAEEGPAASAGVSPGMARAWGIAFDFIVTLLVCMGLGWAVDRWTKTTPIFLLSGLFLGFVLAMVKIVRAMNAEERRAGK